MNSRDYKKDLIRIVNKLGLDRVRKILNDEFHSRDNFMMDYCDLMDINKGESQKVYDYMEEADLIGRKFVLPVFNPPDHDDVETVIRNLTGYDKKIWERINLYLVGTIPNFNIIRHVKIMDVVKISTNSGYYQYDIRSPEFNGYNPTFNERLEKYSQIFGSKLCVIAFTIEWPDDGYETP